MILPIATGGIGNIDLSSDSASRTRTKDAKKETDTFSSLMNMTANYAVDKNDRASSETVKDADDTAKDIYDTGSNPNKISGTSNQEKKYEIEQSDNSDKNSDTEDVTRIMKELKEFISGELGITDAEIQTLLSQLNMNLEDLTDLSNFKEFILLSQGYTNVDVLINEGLSDFVNNAIAGMEQLLQENHIDTPKDFIEMVQQMQKENAGSATVSDITAGNAEYAEEAGTDAVGNRANQDMAAGYPANISDDNFRDGRGLGENYQGYNNPGDEAQTDDVMKNVVNNLNQAVENAFSNSISDDMDFYMSNTSEADIVKQIIDDIKVNITKEMNSIEVQLNPENLGKVHINVTAKEGILTAKIYAENEMARHAIENNMSALKESFNAQDIKVEKIEVMLTSYEFFQDGQNPDLNQKSRDSKSAVRGSLAADEEDVSIEAELESDIMLKNGNTVNYSI